MRFSEDLDVQELKNNLTFDEYKHIKTFFVFSNLIFKQ